ncbi:excalibur calcium-binding domain-containing protein [Marinobacter hydrocarbonoclasticus]|nr:excalibur calcium-binding domain-containing protein [Marinobacter nauticus]
MTQLLLAIIFPYLAFLTWGRRKLSSQIDFSEEAVFFLKNYPDTKMDGNRDGIPCERQFAEDIRRSRW